jgi:uncharacterized protein YukE
MAIKALLLKLAFKILQQVISEIIKQIAKVQVDVLDEMKKFVMQGFDDIWRGEDADQFKEKVLKSAVPLAEYLVGITTNTSNGLNNAAQVITRADQKVNQMVSDLNSTFSKIY